MEYKLWYAVSMQGQGRVFTSKPVRERKSGLWRGESVGWISLFVMKMETAGFRLPAISWDDEPVEIKLTLSYERMAGERH